MSALLTPAEAADTLLTYLDPGLYELPVNTLTSILHKETWRTTLSVEEQQLVRAAIDTAELLTPAPEATARCNAALDALK